MFPQYQEDLMLGMKKIEAALQRNYKKTTPLFIIIILILYILNVNNHYKLFLEESERLRNEIESSVITLQTKKDFVSKIFKNLDLVGQKKAFFDSQISRGDYKIILIFYSFSDVASNRNLVRILNNIKNEEKHIKIVKFSDNPSLKKNINQPSIFLLGKQNQILSAFSLDGRESMEELQLISKYIMKIVPEQ